MFQEMINGSIAVLTKPSVPTFEEHERNNLTWALIYSLTAGLINAVLAAIGATIGLGAAASTGELGGADLAVGGGAVFGVVIFSLIFTVLGLLISWGITYGLGRAFGGTGQFGELAYGLSLFGAPFTVISSLLSLIPIVGGIASFALVIYAFYLTYLAIQSGMNLPSNKALYVILIQLAIGIAVVACIVIFFAAIFAAVLGGSGNFAP